MRMFLGKGESEREVRRYTWPRDMVDWVDGTETEPGGWVYEQGGLAKGPEDCPRGVVSGAGA